MRFIPFPVLLVLFNLLISCEADESPNIIWITIEDTSPQFIGYEGNHTVHTPNIDKLAKEGVRFSNAFATAPVCSSSRSTLITGCRTEALGTGNHRSAYPIPDEIKGFPYYLRKRGYFTSNHSKTDYNIANVRPFIDSAWNESSNLAGWWNRGAGQSFFSVFNYISSHQSRTMTEPYSWYLKNVLEKLPERLRTMPEQIDVPPFYRDTPDMRKHLVRVHNSVNLMDWEVGQLVDSLRRNGLLEETILFFFADHGEGIPRGKTNPTGLGYKVPFFIWFPEKYRHLSPWPVGEMSDELISFEDLPPTILSLVGAPIPDYMTGRPFLGKHRETPRPYVYMSRNRIDESPDLARSISNGRFLYTRVFQSRYPVLKYQKYSEVADITKLIRKENALQLLNPVQTEMLERRPVEYLFDEWNDPWELNNLAQNPACQDILIELRTELRKSIISTRDIHFLPESVLKNLSNGETAYDFRLKADFQINKILEAAWMDDDDALKEARLEKLMRSEDSIVRYWASVSLHQEDSLTTGMAELARNALDDSFFPVRLEMAAALYDANEDLTAKDVLISGLYSKEGRTVLQALQMIQYLNTRKDVFLSAIKEIYHQWNDPSFEPNDRLDIRSCCEVVLHFESGSELFYPNN